MKKWFKYYYFKIFNPVNHSDDTPKLAIEQQIIEYLNKKGYKFRLRLDNSALGPHQYPNNWTNLTSLYCITISAPDDIHYALGTFAPQLGTMVKFNYYTVENKRKAIKLCKRLQRKFGLIMHCALVSNVKVDI
jgi:hypothetical protein